MTQKRSISKSLPLYVCSLLSWAGALEAILVGAQVLSTHLEVFLTLPSPWDVIASTIAIDSVPPIMAALALLYGGLGIFRLREKRLEGEKPKGESLLLRASAFLFMGFGILLVFLLYIYFVGFIEMQVAILASILPILGIIFAYLILHKVRRKLQERSRKDFEPGKQVPIPSSYV